MGSRQNLAREECVGGRRKASALGRRIVRHATAGGALKQQATAQRHGPGGMR